MNLKFLQKNKIILIILIIILLILFFVFIFQKKDQAPIIQEKTQREHTIPARPVTFSEGVSSFIATVKKARISIYKNDTENTKFYTEEAFILWRDVINEFINTPPKEFSDNETWVEDLNYIFESIQGANNLIKNNQSTEASKLLDESRVRLNNIYVAK